MSAHIFEDQKGNGQGNWAREEATTYKYTHREDLEGVLPQIIFITPLHIMDSDQQAIVHNMYRLQELRISSELLGQQCPLFRSKFEHISAVDPVEIFENSPRVSRSFFLRILSAHGAALQVVRFVYILMWREKVVHDHEMDFASMR